MLGTNPICVAAPAGSEPAFVADLATTTAANGKLEILQRKMLIHQLVGYRMLMATHLRMPIF